MNFQTKLQWAIVALAMMMALWTVQMNFNHVPCVHHSHKVGHNSAFNEVVRPKKVLEALLNMSDSEVDTVFEMYERKQHRTIRSKRTGASSDKNHGLALAQGDRLQKDVPPIVVGVCSNIHNTDSGFYRSYNVWAMMLMKDAFPERQVVMNELDKKCLPYEKSKYKVTDVIVCTWNNYDESLKKEIKKYRREHASESLNGGDGGLIVYNNAVPVPHRRGRPMIFADNTETWSRHDMDHDVIIEAVCSTLES
eukprot:m.234056 g.234056  ORF g.234056 m.234056 type:complete len:251 (-) comp19310_c1_seq1:336-1088(-)